MGEGDACQVVGAPRAALGDDDHFGRAAVAAGQGLELVDDTNAVTAEDANELLGRKMDAASVFTLTAKEGG